MCANCFFLWGGVFLVFLDYDFLSFFSWGSRDLAISSPFLNFFFFFNDAA